jgi:hypothetical protein
MATLVATNRQIEGCQRSLQQTRTAGQFVELIEQHRSLLFEQVCLRIVVRQFL